MQTRSRMREHMEAERFARIAVLAAAHRGHAGRAHLRGDRHVAGLVAACVRQGAGGGAQGRAGADRKSSAACPPARGPVPCSGRHRQRDRLRSRPQDGAGTTVARLWSAGAPRRGRPRSGPDCATGTGARTVQRAGPLAILLDLAERGQLGASTGRGFYDWTERDAAVIETRDAFLCMLERGWSEK